MWVTCAAARGEFCTVRNRQAAMLAWKLKWAFKGYRFDFEIDREPIVFTQNNARFLHEDVAFGRKAIPYFNASSKRKPSARKVVSTFANRALVLKKRCKWCLRTFVLGSPYLDWQQPIAACCAGVLGQRAAAVQTPPPGTSEIQKTF